MKHFRPRLSRRAFWVLCALLACLRLALTGFQQAYIWVGGAPLDDELMFRAANNITAGQWLGAYDYLTLSKAMFFPVWLALLHALHLPYLVSGAALWCAASLLAAFAFVYYNFKYKEAVFNGMLLTFFIPITVLIMPNYLLMSKLGLLDTPYGVMLPGLVDGMGIFLMRQTMRSIPKPLLEAAVLDGAKPHQVLFKVILPLIKPSVLAISILFFINSWNEYFWPLLILQDKANLTLPLALQMFISAEGGSEWGVAMAVATLTSLPPLVLYGFCQRFIINTFMQSGVKG